MTRLDWPAVQPRASSFSSADCRGRGGRVEHALAYAPVPVDQIERRAVIDRVGHGRFRRLHPAIDHAVARRQLRQLCLGAGSADEVLAEEAHILGQALHGVTRRIDRDHHRHHAAALRLVELLHDLTYHRHAHRAYVGTVGVAEKEHRQLVLVELVERERPSGRIQFHRPAAWPLGLARELLVPGQATGNHQQHQGTEYPADCLSLHGMLRSTRKSNRLPSRPRSVSTTTCACQGMVVFVQMGT